MSLEYALVTSSSLPEKVKESNNYVEVDKSQWLDLVDYSQDLVSQDSTQRILFLIVAKGTADQQEADLAQNQRNLAKLDALASEEEEEAKRLSEKRRRQSDLRSKSKSIFNALYKR